MSGYQRAPPDHAGGLGDAGRVQRVGADGQMVDLAGDAIKMFGLPQYGDPTVDPMGSVNKTYLTFPEAWGGAFGRPVSNNHISMLLIKTITAAERFMPTVVFPIRLNLDGSPKFSVSQLIFNQHELDRVPELGVPRMLTQRSNNYTVNIPRYGIGFMMEHGFAMTDQGRANYACSIQQITNATWDTIDQEAYAHIFNSVSTANQTDAIWKHHGAPFGQEARAEQIIDYECAFFGALNRLLNPMVAIRTQVEKIMARRGLTPDVCIVPHGAPETIKQHPSQTRMMTGAEAARNALISGEKAIGGPIPDMRVFSSQLVQIYNNDNWDLPDDPLTRTRTIGEFFKVLHPCRKADGENSQDWSTIWVHDNDTDQMAPIFLRDVEANCPFDQAILGDLIREVCDKRPDEDVNDVNWGAFIRAYGRDGKARPWNDENEAKVVAAFGGADAIVMNTSADAIHTGLASLRLDGVLSPFNYLVMRPFEHWSMGSMIFTLSGGRAGFTSVGQANFQISQDGVRKFLLGTFTVNVGVVVTNRDALFVMHNILYKGYENGAGTKFWHPREAGQIGRMSAHQSRVMPSLIVAPIPNFETVDRPHIDLIGYFSASDVRQQMRPHYSTAAGVSAFWGVAGTQEQYFCDTGYTAHAQSSRGLGSRMSQGHQLMCGREEPNRIRMMAQQLVGTGHHGPYSYAGVRKDRLGLGPTGYVRTNTGYEELPTYMRGY